MIQNSNQSWQVGEVVRVGFLVLRVTAREAAPGDYKPDAYILCGLGDKASRQYRFVPHNGIERLPDQTSSACESLGAWPIAQWLNS